MVSPTLSARPNTFKTTLLYTFRSHDKESSYMENVVQRRGWLDSIVFGLQLLVLSFSSYRVHGDITVQHQWIIRRQKLMVAVNLVGMVFFSPWFQKKFTRLSKHLAIWRIPLLAISHLFFTFNLRDNSRVPEVILCSQVWVEASALEKLVGFLIWQSLFPLFAAFPFYVTVVTTIINIGFIYQAIFNMCNLALEICPRTSAQYLLISEIFQYADILFPTAIADAVDQQDLPRCSKSLSWIQISLIGPITLYILMVLEIKNRLTYAKFKFWRREGQELKKRQQPLWKLCGELLLALLVMRQILSTWYDHLYRETLRVQYHELV